MTIEVASPSNDHAAFLRSYLRAEPPTSRLTVGDLADLAGTDPDYTWHVNPRSLRHRYLAARAHGSRVGRRLDSKTVEIREQILGLQDEYDEMTVRQIFYRLVARGVVRKTEQQGYVPVQKQVLALRRQGFLPWGFIADGTRWVRQPATWDNTTDFLRHVTRSYRVDRWRSQQIRIEVWLEKDALAGVLRETTFRFGVPLMVSRGQASDTYCYSAAQEAKAAWEGAGVETIVYTLYDFDKSGRVAAAKIEEKLRTYSDDAPITVEALAVTVDQIEEWDLPTRPAKEKGEPDAVELDAIEPSELIALVHNAIVSNIDPDAWAREAAVEKSEREILLRLSGEAA